MISISVKWSSSHTVEPPEGVSEEDFRQALAADDRAAWDHALAQVDSSTAELTDWESA